MVIHSLNVKKDIFLPRDDNEELFCLEMWYHSTTDALMYLPNNTRHDIAFVISLLVRFSSCPTRRYQDRIKHIFWYLLDMIDKGLLYANGSRPLLIGYVDARYLFDPHKT